MRLNAKRYEPARPRAQSSSAMRAAAACSAGSRASASSIDMRALGAWIAIAARVWPCASFTGTAAAFSPAMNSSRSVE